MKEIKHPRFVDAVTVKIMLVTVREGTGTKEEPVRLVHYYLDQSGSVLFKRDTLEPEDSL